MNTSLSLTDLLSLSPLSILLGGGLLLILLESFFAAEAKKWAAGITLLTLFSAIAAAILAPAGISPLLTNWIAFDSFTHFFTLLFLIVGIATTLLTMTFFKRFQASEGEYYFLLLSAIFGLILISASADFLTLFIGLETLSIALYILCAYIKKWHISREAATKYFLMGALAAGFLLYGIALIYGATGTTKFSDLLPAYSAMTETTDKALFLGGAAFVTLGLAFKAAVVPVHFWAPDVYDGAPTPVTGFMAVGTKIGAFAALLRIFMQALPEFHPLWNQAISWLAVITLIYANYVAMRQVQLRRFFAYSGIAHAGLLLIPIAVGGPEAMSALMFYLVVYALATMGCFAVMAFLDKNEGGVFFQDLYGLFNRSPLPASILALSFLTLAGIPPTAGFLAKFYLFKIAFQAGYYGLVVVGLLSTILSAFYYLRLIALMFTKPAGEESKPVHSLPAYGVALFCLVAIAALSIYPSPLLDLLSATSKG